MYDFRKAEVIERFDRDDMFKLLLELPEQCGQALELSRRVKLQGDFRRIDKIVINGMGGSAVSGDILRSLLSSRLKHPVLVNRDYTIPRFVDKKTLFFANSYSGNTEETLSAFNKARISGAKIIGITSGGRLGELCGRYRFPVYKLPGGQPPRTAIGYLFFPLLQALLSLGLVKNMDKEIEETISYLKKKVRVYKSSKDNLAYTLTRKIFGFIPLIYGSSEYAGAAAFRWKTQFNENSKIIAYHHLFPELDHNEIMGWEDTTAITQKFVILILKDKDDNERIRKRIKITRGVIERKPYLIQEITSEGNSLLTRIFSLILLGDFVSFYLALARGVDPTVIKGINILKEKLARP